MSFARFRRFLYTGPEVLHLLIYWRYQTTLRTSFSEWIANTTPTCLNLSNPSGLGAAHEQVSIDAIFRSPQAEKTRFTVGEEDLRLSMQSQWKNYQSGEMTQDQLTTWFRGKLVNSQSKAFLAGKRARGDFKPISENERAYLHGQYSKQMRYWHKFMNDYSSGKGKMPYRRRADLYALSLWGIFQRALFNRANARYFWMLGVAEHCQDCIRRAAESRAKGGYTLSELQQRGFPGEGKTRCKNQCQCRIKEVGGEVIDLGKRYIKPFDNIESELPRQVPTTPPAIAPEGSQIVIEPNYEAFLKGFTDTLLEQLPTGMKLTAQKMIQETLQKPLPSNWLTQISDQLGKVDWPQDTLGAFWIGWMLWFWMEQERKRKEKEHKLHGGI